MCQHSFTDASTPICKSASVMKMWKIASWTMGHLDTKKEKESGCTLFCVKERRDVVSSFSWSCGQKMLLLRRQLRPAFLLASLKRFSVQRTPPSLSAHIKVRAVEKGNRSLRVSSSQTPRRGHSCRQLFVYDRFSSLSFTHPCLLAWQMFQM